MCAKSYYILVSKSLCQPVRDLLRQERLLDKGSSLNLEDLIGIPISVAEGASLTNVLDPLRTKFNLTECEVQVVERSPTVKTRSPKSGEELATVCKEFMQSEGSWSEELEAEVPRHWERHSNLALFPENSFKSEKWSSSLSHQDSNRLWITICQILEVSRLARKSQIQDNDFRSPKVEFIYGDQDPWVTRKENGIIYHWDITRSMFSVGNISEKLRISKLDCIDEVVVDLFSGIGYFTLPYLVHTGAKHVHACEWNPAAVQALRKNIAANNVQDKCTIYEGDNRELCPRDIADRVNLGLLPTAKLSYKTACLALKSKTGGTLHIHQNVRTSLTNEEPPPSLLLRNIKVGPMFQCRNQSWFSWCVETANELSNILSDIHGDGKSWTLELVHLERVKSFAPHVDHLVMDIKCSPLND